MALPNTHRRERFLNGFLFVRRFPFADKIGQRSVFPLDVGSGNGAALIKVLLAVIVGGLGIYGAVTHGVANQYTAASLMPSFDAKSLSFISVILFNFLGFEVVCTFADNMENPKKQIPQAIVSGGLVIAAIYIFSAFGIGVVKVLLVV